MATSLVVSMRFYNAFSSPGFLRRACVKMYAQEVFYRFEVNLSFHTLLIIMSNWQKKKKKKEEEEAFPKNSRSFSYAVFAQVS